MKTTITSLVILACAFSAIACMQFTGTKYSGRRVESNRAGVARNLQVYLEMNNQNNGLEMEASLRNSTNFNDRSDYAIALTYLGRNQEAVERLLQLEKEQPGQYFIAANLGTAYELAGNNEEGLRWIKEGINRNSDSHDGTEWLHAKILEAKIAKEKEADYFKKHSVLELQPDQIGPVLVVGDKKNQQRKLKRQLSINCRNECNS